MDTSLWNDSVLMDGNWGLDLPFHQENGHFGDLKFESHVDVADISSFQPQDAADQSCASDEGSLGLEWMESSDLSIYLNELGGLNAQLLPLESSLQEFTSLITPDQPAVEDQSGSLNTFNSGDALAFEDPACSGIGFDALLSPPDSPEQVTPVIKLDTPSTESSKQGKDYEEPDTNIADQSSSLLVSEDIFLDELYFSRISNADESSACLDPVVELISSPLSADDVDSLFSASEPSSPTVPSFDKSSSVIKASPELYKIISTSSLDVSKRISPYPKVKPKKEVRSPTQRRSPAQPVPEHVILEQVNKKDRKKLQNKNAAIRYRQKKKDEALGIKSEEQLLEEENVDLKTKVDDLEREIKYMKGLMQDIYKAKGIIM